MFDMTPMDFLINEEEKNCAGIYCIENLINNKVYIGSTNNFKTRHSNHVKDLRTGKHHSYKLQSSFDKYGIQSFVFKKVEIIVNPDERLKKEQIYLDETKCYLENGYNVCKKAKSRYDIKSRPETIEKLRIANTGKKHTEESKLKMSESQKNRKRKPLSETTKKKISDAQKGEKCKNFGKKRNDDFRKKTKDGMSHHCKIILQYDLDNNFIREFIGSGDAAKLTNSCDSHILKCTRGERKTHNNFIWKEKK